MSLIAVSFTLTLLLWAGVMLYAWSATYPMFADIGEREFVTVHRTYERGLPWGVYLPFGAMGLSVLAALVLAPPDVPLWARLVALIALAGGIVTTAFCAAPLHIALIRHGKDMRRIRQMLGCNAARAAFAGLGALAAAGTLLGA